MVFSIIKHGSNLVTPTNDDSAYTCIDANGYDESGSTELPQLLASIEQGK